ncbi:hypothetical protein [uncultured Gammaproteobacteria bacterium]|nr:hypothetical protein [uncultured Gammaproteobacteria bacterium]
MPEFKLREGENQEILMAITTETEKFVIQFNVYDQEIELLEVFAEKHQILELITDEVISSIKSKVFNQLKQENQQNYISAIAA